MGRAGRPWHVLAALGVWWLLAAPVWAQGRTGAVTEEEQVFQKAEELLSSGDYEGALVHYERVNSINPLREEAYVKRAGIYYQKRDYNTAVKLLRKAQEVLPGSLSIKCQLGLIYYKLDALDWAVALLEEVTTKQPESCLPAWQQLADHYLKNGDGKKASEALRQYLQRRPESLSSQDFLHRVLLSRALLMDKKYDDAVRELEALRKVNPGDLSVRLYLATAYTAQGECLKAIQLYEQALRDRGQTDPSMHYNLGVCYLRMNREADAVQQAEAFLRQRDQEVRGWLLLGDTRLALRDAPAAIAAYEKALARKPATVAEVNVRIARADIALGKLEAAQALLDPLYRERPEDSEVLALLVDVYKTTRPGDTKQLLGLADRLAQRNHAEAQTAAGVAYYVAERDDQAQAAFSKALSADSRAVRARTGLVMSLNRAAGKAVAQGALGDAELLLTQAHMTDPSAALTSRNLGLVELLAQKYPAAEQALLQAQTRLPRDLLVHRLLGRLYAAVGRRGEALKAYQTAAAIAAQAGGIAYAPVGLELGQLYGELGQLDEAVAALEKAIGEPGNPTTAMAVVKNLAGAYYRRGLLRLKEARTFESAYEDLSKANAAARKGLSGRDAQAVACALVVAALKTDKLPAATDALGQLTRDKDARCQLAPPYDKLDVDFLSTYVAYRTSADPAGREAAVRTLNKLLPRASGSAAVFIRELIRSSYEIAGAEWYGRNDVRRSAQALQNAQRMATGGGEHRTLDHNLAVLDLAEGRIAPAERVFEQLSSRPPEALANLGIVRDKQGDARKALELYRKAVERGARSPKLKEWIDIKERLLGGAGAVSAAPLRPWQGPGGLVAMLPEALAALDPIRFGDGGGR